MTIRIVIAGRHPPRTRLTLELPTTSTPEGGPQPNEHRPARLTVQSPPLPARTFNPPYNDGQAAPRTCFSAAPATGAA